MILAEELRRVKPDVRVILSSGYTQEEATSRFADKGLAGFIQKPYAYDSLIAKPVYTSAIGRWRNYERHLAPVLDAMQPYVAAFGYDA